MSIESNADFKDIDKYEHVMTVQKIAKFKSSLKFISVYSHVSFGSMANYSRSYPIGVYEKDKDGWLQWYEENKCSNIQFNTEYNTQEVDENNK
jgi:hypothetical protein